MSAISPSASPAITSSIASSTLIQLQQVVTQLQSLVEQLASMPSLQSGPASTAQAAMGADATAPSTVSGGGSSGCGCQNAVSGVQLIDDAAIEPDIKGMNGAPSPAQKSIEQRDSKPPASAMPAAAPSTARSNMDDTKRKNPKSVEEAIAWGRKQVKHRSQNWDHLCLAFVTQAYGWSGGAPSAISKWNSTKSSLKHKDSNPPRGALVYWKTGSYGHVALSLGNGKVLSNDFKRAGQIDEVSLDAISKKWGGYLGWTPPEFPDAGR